MFILQIVIIICGLALASLISLLGGVYMTVSATTVAKITSAVASDKNARKVIDIIIGSVIGLLLIPLIAYMGIIGNMDSIEIDTNQVQQSIIQNMSAEEKAKLHHIVIHKKLKEHQGLIIIKTFTHF